jgi:hypothetical protein
VSERAPIAPEDCPEPFWHETHRYCPICTWTEDQDKPEPEQPQSPIGGPVMGVVEAGEVIQPVRGHVPDIEELRQVYEQDERHGPEPTVAMVIEAHRLLTETDRGKLLQVALAVKVMDGFLFDGHEKQEPDEDNPRPYCFECEDEWPCRYEDLRQALAEVEL